MVAMGKIAAAVAVRVAVVLHEVAQVPRGLSMVETRVQAAARGQSSSSHGGSNNRSIDSNSNSNEVVLMLCGSSSLLTRSLRASS